jgi:NAD(P)-dependent dehydrogenase (short-subunit alcohol dehydrogenase family)
MAVMLVTGGSRGIGAAVCRLAGAAGWDVAVNYARERAAAEAVVADVVAAGRQAVAMQGDVAREEDQAFMYDAAEALGPVRAVIINAGIVAPVSPVAEMATDRLRRVFDVNVLGAFLTAREAARRMPADRGGPGGAIVVVSSAAARLGSPFEFVDYAASKGAMDTLTLGLAKELGPQGVRVNAVRPGLIETEIHASAGAPDRVARLVGGVPLGRPGSAEEVAETILWLASDAASYVSGALVDVGGGR